MKTIKLLAIPFLLCLLPGMVLQTKAQSKYFNKIIELDEGVQYQDAWRVFPLSDTTFALTGSELGENEVYIKPFLIVIDDRGNVLQSHHYDLESNYDNRCLAGTIHEGQIVVCGQRNGDTSADDPESSAFFLKLEPSGAINKYVTYDSLWHWNFARDVCTTGDGHLLLSGVSYALEEAPDHANRFYQYLIKVDREGNKVWEKYYAEFNSSRGLRSVLCSPDGSSYYLFGSANGSIGNPDPIDMFLAKTDTAGNLLESHVWGDQESETANDALYLPNGDILVVGTTIPGDIWIGEDGVPRGRILKITPECGVLWFKDYFFGAAFISVVMGHDGNYVAGGVDGSLIPPYDADAFLAKTDTAGNLLWSRLYGSLDEEDYFRCLSTTSDGGYIFAGRTDSTEIDKYFAWVVKTNCMGLLTEPEADFSYQSQATNNEVMFQNLSQYAYPDSIDGGHYLWDFGDGSPVFVADTSEYDALSHTYPLPGNYQVTLTAVVCSDTSEVRLLVQAGSGFGGTTPVEPVVLAPRREVRVFPNPATENINIAYRLEEGEVATIKLFDFKGTLLVEQQVTGAGIFVKSTQYLNSGVYFCEAVLNGEALLRNKLVVVK